MKLAALPRHTGKGRLTGGFEPGMDIAYHEPGAMQATSDKAFEEVTSVGFGLGELHAAAEDAALTIRADADRREEGAAHDRPVVADLFAAGIDYEVGDFADRPIPARSTRSRMAEHSSWWGIAGSVHETPYRLK